MQKTAYEMRISDWISDVCSSDLPRIAAADLRVERLSVSHGVDVEQPITNLIGDDPNDRSGQRIGNEGCERRDGHIGPATQCQQRRNGHLCERHNDPDDNAQGHTRSEEHTSELQSLMRNSYAVFCLNKKITK